MPIRELTDMGRPDGFSFKRRKNGDVVIEHNGRLTTTLRGLRAERFLTDVQTKDPQQLMARVTGNYKRGNERR
ncbi:MAG: hypothetical protein WCC01_14980 [Acidimicrobiia bacterium]